MVAKVNGEAITAQQFEQAYQRAAEYAMRNDPSLTREALVQQKLGRQVLNELISAQLIRQEAARVGMTVSPEEMHYVVSKLPRSRTPRASSIPRPTSVPSKPSA